MCSSYKKNKGDNPKKVSLTQALTRAVPLVRQNDITKYDKKQRDVTFLHKIQFSMEAICYTIRCSGWHIASIFPALLQQGGAFFDKTYRFIAGGCQLRTVLPLP